jgi:plasmid replication initiation protein
MSYLESKQQIIRKSNELITARYKLSIAEQRLVLLLASEISPDDDDFKAYEIRVADFAKMFGLESDKSIYEKLEQAAEGLLSQKIILQNNNTKELTNWLSYVKYVKGSGVVNLEFHKSLRPYLLQLKSHFTQYNSNYVMNFNGQYSVRIYELLKMDAYKAKNGKFEKYFDLNEFRSFLYIGKNEYTLFANLKNRVIQPAINEISGLTDLFINDVKYGKTGRKITNVTFIVEVRTKDETHFRQANLLTDGIQSEKESENHPIIDLLVSLGFSLEIAKKYKNKHGVKKIERNIAYTLAKNQERSISDVPSYLNKAIENDYGLAWEIKRKKEADEKQQSVAAEKSKKDDDARKRKESKEKHETALAGFYALSQDAQDGIKKDFLNSIKGNTFVLNEWAKTERANQNPIERPVIKSIFTSFLMNLN